MMSLRWPPAAMPGTPSSHPGMTWPTARCSTRAPPVTRPATPRSARARSSLDRASDRPRADLQVDRLEPVGEDDRRQAVACVKVVKAWARSRSTGALVGDRAGARVRIRIAARGRRQHDAGHQPGETPPHQTLMSIDFMVSPTWILSITSIPEVTSPKWLYTPLLARNGASPSVMKNWDPLTPAALDAMPAGARGQRDALLSSGSL